MNIDNKNSLVEHSKIIKSKPLLLRIYVERYKYFKSKLKKNSRVVELGSGGGFIKEIMPQVITSDVILGPNIDKVFFAEKMPFKEKSIDAFVMIDVFHHIKDPERSLKEMSRCLKKKGKIIMIEPYNSLWGRLIYQNLHHEDFDPTKDWRIKGRGRMSDANGALPWIVFIRDREIFYKKFPQLKITNITAHTPFLYLFSGGISKPQLIPSYFLNLLYIVERILKPLNKYLAMFVTIEIKKTNS